MSSDERREQLLDVAHGLIETEGFHGATIARIAQHAGVTRAVVYQNFGDVSNLFLALIDRESERVSEQYRNVMGRESTDGGHGVGAFANLLEIVEEHPRSWRLFLVPPEGAPPELHERLARNREALRRTIEGAVRKAAPELKDPELAALVIQAVGRELLALRVQEVGISSRRLLATAEIVFSSFGRGGSD